MTFDWRVIQTAEFYCISSHLTFVRLHACTVYLTDVDSVEVIISTLYETNAAAESMLPYLKDDFQRSLSTLMFINITTAHSMEYESTLFVTNHIPHL